MLLCAQPLLLYKAQVLKHAHRRILVLFVPITLVSTPLGQLVSAYVPTKIVQAVAGGLVTFVACFEIYRKRNWFLSMCKKKEKKDDKGGSDNDVEANNGDAGKGHVEETVHSNKEDEFKDNPSAEQEVDVSQKEVEMSRSAMNADATNNKSDQTDTQPSNNTTSQSNKPEEPTSEEVKIGLNKLTFWTLLAGGASGFLGGMVAIRGPPLIFYFLHPPKPVSFNKNSQRATGVVIMFFNVFMRQIYYLVNTFTDRAGIGYESDDWQLYLSVILCSIAGGLVGSKLFEYLKDSKDTIRGILAIFLFLCGVSLLFSAFR